VKPRASSGLLDRRVQHRDARLFVIAVEGERTGSEYVYFTALEQLDLIDRRRIKLEILVADAAAHDSAPTQVLHRLEQFTATYHLRGLDQCWLILDRDRWPERALSEVCQATHQAQINVALSNPCFELWLILHDSDDLAFLATVDDPRRPRACKRRLGELRSQGVCGEPTRQSVWRARDTAQVLDADPATRWPQQTGSRVYRLIDALAEAGALRRG
jgi:hypothetical protein